MTVSDGKSWERWNTHFSTTVEQEVFGCAHALLCQQRRCALLCRQAPPPVSHYCRHPFKLAQDPNSQHLGTTVWDSSIVLAKYLEKVSRGRTHALLASAAITSCPRATQAVWTSLLAASPGWQDAPPSVIVRL